MRVSSLAFSMKDPAMFSFSHKSRVSNQNMPTLSSRATLNCAIQFNPDRSHLWKWIGINPDRIQIGRMHIQCGRTQTGFDPFQCAWVPGVDAPQFSVLKFSGSFSTIQDSYFSKLAEKNN